MRAGAAYGRGDAAAGRSINVEFISANPTGPLHLGHTRWAAVGDAIARVVEAAGARVHREFYINDRGVQMDRFGESLLARATGVEPPEDGYRGDYVADLAKQVVAEVPGILDLPVDQPAVAFREEGYRVQLAEQRRVLDGASARTSTPGPPSGSCTPPAPSSGPSPAPRAGARLRVRGCGLAAHHRLRR